jgi:hypothetical protein
MATALPIGAISSAALHKAASTPQSANTRRGSNRSARPLAATASAPATKPSCTPLDSIACRTASMPDSRTMSGRIAAEANHRLIPAISARTSRVMEVDLETSGALSESSWSDLVRP